MNNAPRQLPEDIREAAEAALPSAFESRRRKRIAAELKIALDATSKRDLSAWAGRSGRYLVSSGLRRVGRLWSVVSATGDMAANEWSYIKNANSIENYAHNRAAVASTHWKAIRTSSVAAWRDLSSYSRQNPTEAASRLTLLCLGFNIGSGGLDGDGGIPDTDWTIAGTHRSIFTHSIVAGVVIEVAVAAFVDLVSTFHEYLPNDHDPVWDSIKAGSSTLNNFALGTSLGIAYHLGVDATIDTGGRYSDLPFSAPLEVHQAIAGGNALAEGLDAVARLGAYGDTVATYGNLDDAREAIVRTDSPTSYVIRRLKDDSGFRITWRPRQTPKPT